MKGVTSRESRLRHALHSILCVMMALALAMPGILQPMGTSAVHAYAVDSQSPADATDQTASGNAESDAGATDAEGPSQGLDGSQSGTDGEGGSDSQGLGESSDPSDPDSSSDDSNNADGSAVDNGQNGGANGSADGEPSDTENADEANEADETEEADEDDVMPLGNLTMPEPGPGTISQDDIRPYLTVTGSEQAAENSYLVRTGETTKLDVQFAWGQTNASAGSRDNPLTITLNVPYLINNSGAISTTLDKEEWEQSGSDMRLAIMPDMSTNWVYYVDGVEATGEQIADGLSGVVVAQYIGGKGDFSAGDQVPTQQVVFKGNVPENAGADISVGMNCTIFTDSSGETTHGNLEIKPEDTSGASASQPRKVTFINTNLTWTNELENLDQPVVLWNKYNYMVYKLTVTNTSPSAESVIDRLQLNFTIPTGSNGMLQENIAAWAADEDGEVTGPALGPEAGNEAYRGQTLVGQPGEGGVLIYDVTELNEDQLAELDTSLFSNVADLGLNELPYRSLDDGNVNLNIPAPDGTLISNRGNPDGPNNDSRTFYIALPYTTNFTPIDGVYPSVSIDGGSTVYFGEGGRYSWSKTSHATGQFDYPETGFEQRKHAVDLDTGALVDRADGRLGWLSSYVIDGMRTTGNIPVYGAESTEDGDPGPWVVDTLPEYYTVQSIDLEIEDRTASGLAAPELTDWFWETAQVEFEFKQANGQMVWSSVGSLAATSDDTADGATYKVWRLGAQTDDESGSVDSLVRAYEGAHSVSSTGRMRVVLRDALPVDTELPIRIKISGILDAPMPQFLNTVEVHYGQRQWVPGAVEAEAHYTVNERVSTPDDALFDPIQDVDPTVDATAHVTEADGTETTGDTVDVPLSNGTGGWKFTLGNTSSSYMEPSRFETSALPFTAVGSDRAGFVTNEVVLSSGLLDNSDITQVQIYVEGSNTPVTITPDQLETFAKDDEGNIHIPASAWGDRLFSHVAIDFESFHGPVAADDNAFVDIVGSSHMVADYTVTGTLKTMYTGQFESENKQAEDSATVSTISPEMSLSTHGRYVDVAEATKQPFSANTDNNQTQISVPYDRDFQLWATFTNDGESLLDDVDMTLSLPLKWETGIVTGKDGDGNPTTTDAWTGFHTTGITLTSELLSSWAELGEIRLYDANSDMTAPTATLKAERGAGGAVTVTSSDGSGVRVTAAAGDDLAISEDQLRSAGITNLKAVKLYSWKGMQIGSNNPEQQVILDGFEDSALGASDTLEARAVNHFGSVRAEGSEDDPLLTPATRSSLASAFGRGLSLLAANAVDNTLWSKSVNDSTLVYVSKMFFDAAARAGYYDGEVGAEGPRFTSFTTPSDPGHWVNTSTEYYSPRYNEPNGTLEIGYKAIGSYLFDFRQYLNAYNQTQPDLYNYRQDQQTVAAANAATSAAGTLLSGKTYNTAASLHVTQDLPEDYFDAYYILVQPSVLDHVDDITVHYSDGTSFTVKSNEILAHAGNAEQADDEGDKCLRIGLLDGSADWTSGEAEKRDAVTDYAEDDYSEEGAYNGRTVTHIEYTFHVNRDQYTSDVREEANVPDFGTDYDTYGWPSGDDDSDDADNAFMEVTGRFYRVDDRDDTLVNSTSTVQMTIGDGAGAIDRTGACAVTRFTDGADTPEDTGKSDWSYHQYVYRGGDYMASHLRTTSKVDVVPDSQFVLKGVHDNLTFGADNDTNVAIGSDQHYSVSFYRTHVPFSRYNPSPYNFTNYDKRAGDDWNADGGGRVSFADTVKLTDELPEIRPDSTLGYYGFLATALRIDNDLTGEGDGAKRLLDHVEDVTFTATTYTEGAPDAEGNPTYSEGTSRQITVTHDELVAALDATDQAVYVDAAPQGVDPAPELDGKAKVLDLSLGENEFLTSYVIQMDGFTGDADGSREVSQTYDGEKSGSSTDVDLVVYGRPYAYSGQTDTVVADATNTMTATYTMAYDPDTELASPAADSPQGNSTDTAYMLGYLIPFQTTANISLAQGTDTAIYDYELDNNTPTVTEFEVRYKNRPDVDSGANRSAWVGGATLTSSISEFYRMQHLYIPKEFVATDLGGAASWFQTDAITLVANGKTKIYQLSELKDSGYLTGPDAQGRMAVDVEAILRADANAPLGEGLTSTYNGLGKTNTMSGYNDTAWDLTYTNACVSRVALTFTALDPEAGKQGSALEGGQYLSPGKDETGYAFAYDGVWVDRTQDDFKSATGANNGWNETSTPAFGKQGNAYNPVTSSNTVAISDVVSVDPNNQAYKAYTEDGFTKLTQSYTLNHLLGIAQVEVLRGREATIADLNEGRVFAYDRDDTWMNRPSSDEVEDSVSYNIANGELFAGDYVEYTVDVAALTAYEADIDYGVLPLSQVQGRFTAPKGQRIVGWEVVENDTGLDVTGNFVNEDGTAGSEAAAKTDYRFDSTGADVNNHELYLSVGSYDEADPEASEVDPGKHVTVRVITQMTNELETETDYQTTDNPAFEENEPSYEGDGVEAHFTVVPHPRHGYMQQTFVNMADQPGRYGGHQPGTDHNVYNYAYEYDIEGNQNTVYYDIRTNTLAGEPGDTNKYYGLDVHSTNTFFDNAAAEADPVTIEGEFTEESPIPGPNDETYKRQNDGSPAELTVSNIKNRSDHTGDVTVTVSFMQEVGTGAKAREYQAFELTEEPTISYPANMPENTESARQPVKVEYFDSTVQNADGTLGAWVERGELSVQTLPSVEEEEAAAGQNTNVFTQLWNFFTGSGDEPVPMGASEYVRSTPSAFHNVTAVRWTYFDVPATVEPTTGKDIAAYQLDDVTLVGVGRFADTREATGDTELNDFFGGESVDLGVVHNHTDRTVVDGYQFAVDTNADDAAVVITKNDEESSCELPVWRRVPTLTFQTQTFQTEGQASTRWDPDAKQKSGYVPGEAFWYKDTLWNMPMGWNEGAPNLEGELYNPVIYERIPVSYLESVGGGDFALSPSDLGISWIDYTGAAVAGAKVASVERVDNAVDGIETGSTPDYGGAMVYDSKDVPAQANGSVNGYTNKTKGYFSDMDPTAEGTSQDAEYVVYKITFENADTQDGTTTMNPGDRIEIWFDVQAKTDGLPQVYLDADGNLADASDQSPAYFPRIGEYFAGYDYYSTYYVNPLNGASAAGNMPEGVDQDGFGVTNVGVGAVKVANSQVLMDMDALMHDAAASGDKPAQSDRWESFDASLSYLPGMDDNDNATSNVYTSGNNDVYLDGDVKNDVIQRVRYTPRVAGTDVASRDLLPGDTWYLTPNDVTTNINQNEVNNRDYAEFVTLPRTEGDVANSKVRWASEVPLVWSETSLHLQKGWLATASSLEADTGDYEQDRSYLPNDYSNVANDPHASMLWGTSIGEAGTARGQKGVVGNKYQTALQYNQDFTASLQALNYGDRTFDGVEMVYVMPRGVEPDFAQDGAAPAVGGTLSASDLGVTAEVLESVAGPVDITTDAHVDETYAAIDASNITVEVLQTPYSVYQGYDAPSDSQDPAAYREGAELKDGEQDLSVDPSLSTYEAKASSEDDNTTEAYAESSQPWVLKITVKHDLGKWYGRDIDGDATNTADADAYTGDAGYKINVDVPAHVFSNNANGYWYDRLMATPWDDPADAQPSPASSYFSVLDIDHFEGANALAANHNDMQVYGMDYVWSMNNIYTGATWDLATTSPNMPSVGGRTVQNNTVTAADSPMGAKVTDRTTVGYDKANKNGTVVWAQTGTQAIMRKPLVRTWASLGENGVTGGLEEYYLNGEFDASQMNVHVENRYWWDEYVTDADVSGGYEAGLHGYATDGGSKGDLVLPVVTTVLPQDIAVIDEDGKPYPTDGTQHELTSWKLSTATADDYAVDSTALTVEDATAKSRFSATVSYEEVCDPATGERGKRYVVRFVANDPAAWNAEEGNIAPEDAESPDAYNTESRIPTGGLDTFSFDICTFAGPEGDPAHPETARGYENAYTYVSSKLPGFRFIADSDIEGNPYYVGAPAQVARYNSHASHGVEGDARLDASVATAGRTTLGVIPADTLDDGPDTRAGRQNNTLPGYQDRYLETDALNIEDYTFRSDLALTEAVRTALDADGETVWSDSFNRKATGKADTKDDEGAQGTIKFRIASPRLEASYEVQVDPQADLPSPVDDGTGHSATADTTGHATDGNRVGRDGSVVSVSDDPEVPTAETEPLQYGDTPWYAATISNTPEAGNASTMGSVLHAKLVFAVHLPSQVSFYDGETLADDPLNAANADQFYLIYNHTDRQTGQEVTETLTPQDLADQGWHVNVTAEPNWAENDYSQDGYGKPDADAPNETVPDDTTKPKSHEGETLVFEIAAPNDATDEEFEQYESLVDAARHGVKIDGAFETGDSITLMVRTRVDNAGSEDTAGDLTTQWLADNSTFYGTVHETDGGFIDAFRHGNEQPKPVYVENSDNFFDRPLDEQSTLGFTWVNQANDAPEQVNLAFALPPVEVIPAVDYDADGDYTDVYTSATSGDFAIAKPEVSVRGDTQKNRENITNPDLGEQVVDDAHLGGEQRFVLSQAVNEGSAVNSFVVNWDVPYFGTYDPTTSSPTTDDVRFNSSIESVRTGVWEIPGSDYEAAEDTDAYEKALWEQQLRVYMLVRVAPSRDTAADSTIYSDTNRPHPGESADRADYDAGVWRVVGNQAGYPVRNADGTKTNTTIDLYSSSTPGHLTVSEEAVTQIRWVVKAAPDDSSLIGMDAVTEDDGANALPVPHGFRLDIDADPYTVGKQEADEVDPDRLNTGWQFELDEETGEPATDADGNRTLEYESPMYDEMLANTAGVIGNATSLTTLHLNHFVIASARYDDTKYLNSDACRVGFYRDPEHPYLKLDMEQYYFNGGSRTQYEWQSGLVQVSTGNSLMMKYKITLTNLSNEQLAELGINAEADSCTNPDISAMLPFISALVPTKDFTYVPGNEVVGNPNNMLNDDYVSAAQKDENGDIIEYAHNLDDATPLWTYYLQNSDSNANPPVLASTDFNSDSARSDLQLGSDLEHDREYLSWHFTGEPDNTNEGNGVLMPGESLVIEFMMPIREDAASMGASGLLDAKGFGHKEGSYSPYIPESQETTKTTSYESDTRDANLDDSTAQLMLVQNLTGLSFVDNPSTLDAKTSTTQVDTLFTREVQGAAAAPEGTEYTYAVSTMFQGTNADTAEGYVLPVIYDILPYQDDTEIRNTDDGEKIERGSQWHGWLTTLGGADGEEPGTSSAVRVMIKDPEQGTYELEPDQYTLWVGPFKANGGAIEALGEDAIGDLTGAPSNPDQLRDWMDEHAGNDAKMQELNLVRLSEVQEYLKAHPEDEETLRKATRAIWCEVTDETVSLPPQGSIELQYDMRAPLNLPKYLGDTDKTAPDADEESQPLYQRLMETVQWNSFFHYVLTGGVDGNGINIGELVQAGVMIDAPENRGYLGDYVWLDTDWSREQDDTSAGADAYQESVNGRKLIRGVTADGTAFDNSGSFIDLNGDGTPDDPGINGVTVELLNENGLPVNRDGEVVQWIDGIGQDNEGEWVVCDPATGDPVTDAFGSNIVATAGAALSFTTETDYYGNKGYYILSNLATEDGDGNALKYRLRFTFPEQYAAYAVTTLQTGAGDGMPVNVDVSVEEAADGTKRLVATTREAVAPEPVAYDQDKFANGEDDPIHDAYDARAVSLDMGIALPVTYGGVVWRDDLLSDGATESEPIDGYLDEQRDPSTGDVQSSEDEQRIEGAVVTAYEYDPVTQTVASEPAFDVYGKPAQMTTEADGAYSFDLEPNKHYVIRSTVDGQLIKPTPYLWNQNPITAEGDNDLRVLHGNAETYPFQAVIPQVDGAIDYVDPADPGQGYNAQHTIDLGYVDGTRGFIGDRVWDDADQDGIQDANEQGIEGVEVTLEQYWWDEDAQEWKLNDAQPTLTEKTSAAGTYVFEVSTYTVHPDDVDKPAEEQRRVLAGYKLRIDQSALEALGYPVLVTGQNQGNDDEIDSDLAQTVSQTSVGVAAGDQGAGEVPTRYLTEADQYITVASEASEGTLEGNTCAGPGGVRYDIASGESVTTWDAGLIKVPAANITGIVWEDADHDGIQDAASGDVPAEVGIAGQNVVLEQYYLDGDEWVRNDAFGNDAFTTDIVTDGTAQDGKITVATAADGTYLFDNLPSAYVASTGEAHLAGYRLTLESLAPDHLLTRYHANMSDGSQTDTTRIDSDVKSSQTLAITDRDSFDASDNEAGTRANSGQVILAAPSEGGAAGFNVTDPSTGKEYNLLKANTAATDENGVAQVPGGDVGELAIEGADIAGTLWSDADYDGLHEAGESGLAGKQVTLHRWMFVNGAWEALDASIDLDGDPATDDSTEVAYTDADGAYLFEDEPVFVQTDEGIVLMGYTITVLGDEDVEEGASVEGMPVTAIQASSPDMDSANSKVRRPASSGDDLEIRWNEQNEASDNRRVLDGKIVLAAPADSMAIGEYVVAGFDYSRSTDELRMNGGFGPFPTSSLTGVVWEDRDYDGLQQLEDPNDPERGMAGLTVYVTQYYLGADGSFHQNELFGAQTEDEGELYAMATTTDEAGRYTFDNLPVYIPLKDGEPAADGEVPDDDFALAAYRVSLAEVPDGFAVTRYHVGNDHRLDSDLRSNAAREDLDIVEIYEDGAEGDSKVTRGDGYAILAEPVADENAAAYTSTYNNVWYDTLRALGVQAGGDAGLIEMDGEGSLAGMVFEDKDDSGTRDFMEGGIAGVKVELTRYFRPVNAADMPAPVDGASWYLDEAFGSLDAATGADGIWCFEGLPSMGSVIVDGTVVPVIFGYRVSIPEVPARYGVSDLNVGDDATVDSDLDEGTTRILPDDATNGLTVLAELWTDDADVSTRVDVEGLGSYNLVRSLDVDHLDAGLVPAPNARIAGWVWDDANENGISDVGELLLINRTVTLERQTVDDATLEGLGFGVAKPDAANGAALDASGAVIGASAGDASDGGSTVAGEDALIGSATADNAGERLEDDGILSVGDWEEVASTSTGLTGEYAFEDLPTTDDQGRPYRYRVSMVKPDGYRYTVLDVNGNARDDRDNDYAHKNVLGEYTPENIGITSPVVLLEMRSDGVNAYGQSWNLKAPKSYDRDHANAIDLGVVSETGSNDFVGLMPQTGDPMRLVCAIMLALAGVAAVCAGAAFVIVRRRRKKDDKRGAHAA